MPPNCQKNNKNETFYNNSHATFYTQPSHFVTPTCNFFTPLFNDYINHEQNDILSHQNVEHAPASNPKVYGPSSNPAVYEPASHLTPQTNPQSESKKELPARTDNSTVKAKPN